jgi:hypothetical protein
MIRRNTDALSLITNNVRNTVDHCLTISHGLIDQENLCAKSFKMTDVVVVVSKLVNFIWLKEMNQ